MNPRLTLRLPPSLKSAAQELAGKAGMSLNQFIARAMAEKIGSSGAVAFLAKRGQTGDPERVIAFLEGRPE